MILRIKIQTLYVLLASWILLVVTSCNTTKHLQQGQSLVKKTTIVFKSSKDIPNKTRLETELLTLIKQKPNGKFFFFVPREWLYFTDLKSQGQEPVIYGDSITKKTAKDIENFLRFKRGYYHAIVDFVTDETKHQRSWQSTSGQQIWDELGTEVTYVVSLGDRYKIRSIDYEGEDPELLDFVKSIASKSKLKVGDFVTFDDFELEKFRLTTVLQNEGFQAFSSNSIEITGDSSIVNKNIAIYLKFRNPQNVKYTKYNVGRVNVYTDYVQEAAGLRIIKENINSLDFYRQSERYLVSPKTIDKHVFLRPGSLLRKDDKTKTFRRLTDLSTYRFVTINSNKDPLVDTLMNFDIVLNPHNNKWILDGETGGYLSTLDRKYLWGVNASASLQNRNTFGGSELYTLNLTVGSEFGRNLDDKFVPRTANVSIQNALSFPTFRDYLGMGKVVSKAKIMNSKKYKNFTDEATTNIQLGYNYTGLLRLYNIGSFNSGFGYNYTSLKSNRYVLRPLGFNVEIYEIIDSTQFVNNPLQLLSFTDNLSTGFIFRDFSFVLNLPQSRNGTSWTLYNNLEFSGLEVDLLNRLSNKISGDTRRWELQGLNFAKYIRDEIDLRFKKEYARTSVFAARFNLGAIVPFGSERVSPFLKQFIAGGPNSMRGWRLRELGPGGYRDPNEFITRYPLNYVNQGDLKLEINGEYRFKIVYFFDGALFVDVGNVWALRKDVQRPNANISTDFYKQLAVAGGWGLRLNFDYFIIRFDFGYKLRSPYLISTSNSHWYSRSDLSSQGIGNIQIAVSYAF